MKLWLLENPECDWDEFDGFVVWAIDEMDARRVAYEGSGTPHRGPYQPDTRDKDWLKPERTTCSEAVLEGPSRVILGSFRAG